MSLKPLLRAVKNELLPRARFFTSARHASVSPSVSFAGATTDVQLGRHVTIAGPTVINVANGGGLTGSRLVIGDRTYIGEFNNIRCAGAPITIGTDCLISQHITIVGTNHGTDSRSRINQQPWTGDGVVIGNDVWIGAGAVIMPGARIGDGAVIGAGSVVRGEVEPGWIVVGSPARPVRHRSENRVDTPSSRD